MKTKSDITVMLREAGILFGITLIAGLLLGFVYELTREPRRLQQEKAVQEACIAVFPDAQRQGWELRFEDTGYVPGEALAAELAEDGVTIGTVYAAYNGDVFYGAVAEAVSSKGYGGDIVLYVGVGLDGAVNGVSITKISETAGLGMEAPNVLTPQFAGKSAESFVFTKTGASAENEVDVISSATITTRAVTNAVNGGMKAAKKMMEEVLSR